VIDQGEHILLESEQEHTVPDPAGHGDDMHVSRFRIESGAAC
jgi:hypothetical protein